MFQDIDSQNSIRLFIISDPEIRDREVIEGVHTPRFISDLPAIHPTEL
jgi:hypothetical protein